MNPNVTNPAALRNPRTQAPRTPTTSARSGVRSPGAVRPAGDTARHGSDPATIPAPDVVAFDDPRATELALCGGKGASLACMAQAGLPVPPGFVVTSALYRAFRDGASDLLAGVAELPFEDPEALRHAGAELRAALLARPLPARLGAALDAALARFPTGARFGVRSSSTMEDLAGAAFAGQHDTFLNCRGRDEILARIHDAFVSLWHDRAIAYRHRAGFDARRAEMAVVVQRMVDCDTAGVAFGINPVSGDLGEIVVDACYGLGEAVVGGESPVDHFALDKADGTIRRSSIAHKHARIVSLPEGGTRSESLPTALTDAPCLDAAELADVAALTRAVEAVTSFPQDIEWGFASDGLYLLQSRPITTVPPRWTRDESAERFPNVITPLTWDFVEDAFHDSLTHSFALLGFPLFEGRWFALHGHYVYGNQNAVELYARRTPFATGSLEDLRRMLPELAERYRWVQELPTTWMRDLDRYLIGIGELLAEPLEDADLARSWDYVQRVRALGRDYFLPNIAISIAHGALSRFALGLLEAVLGANEGRTSFDALMAWCDTKTSEINRELYELVELARREPALHTLLDAQPSRRIIERDALAAFPAFATRFETFLRDHGHRELDFDTYHPTWREAPWTVLDNVKLMLHTPGEASPTLSERRLRRRQAEAEMALLLQLPADLRTFAAEVLRLARTYTRLDDLEHYQTSRLSLPMRRGLRAVGEQLVARGVLDEPMDVFFCRADTLDVAIRAESGEASVEESTPETGVESPLDWTAIGRAAREAKRSYLAAREQAPAWELGTTEADGRRATGGSSLSSRAGRATNDGAQRPEDEDVGLSEGEGEGADEETTLHGLPGSPGCTEGVVFVLRSTEDFARFPQGAVLVTRTTNPTWTPLFYRAAAVVTESGGPLSHGAVTAREMGTPAVMSVRDVMARLRTGDRVRVDGSAGRVAVLSRARTN